MTRLEPRGMHDMNDGSVMTGITHVPARDELWMVLQHPKACTEGVTRNGEYEPCDRDAVAIALDPEAYPNTAYPVCKHHARGRQMLRLEVLLNILGVRS
jgi:hypothetical protein